MQLNRGLAGYDRTHNFQTYWVLSSPFGAGHKWLSSGLAGTILGDWQLNGVLSATSGLSFAVVRTPAAT
jgi:hypothetical protein